jgi:uncharacterized coiled-coil protein SlyX
MARMIFRTLVICAFAFATFSANGQSLGDVARQQRAQNAKNPSQTHKVLTDEDMPEHASSDSDKNTNDSASSSSDISTGKHSSADDKLQTGEGWKSVIGGQKQAVAEMQSQLDKLNASIHYVEANRYSNGVEYNQYQAQKQKAADRMQAQLDEQKKKLSEMQEKARRQGFSSTVYDP